MTAGRLRQSSWLVPLAIAALVAIFGWWGNIRFRHIIEQQIREQLSTTLNANANALEGWLSNQKTIARTLAEESSLKEIASNSFARFTSSEARPPGPRGPGEPALRNYLLSRLRITGYDVAELVTPDFRIADAVSADPGHVPAPFPGASVSQSHTNKFVELFDRGRAVIITPYRPELELPQFFFGRGRGQRAFGGRGFPGPGGTNVPPGGFARGASNFPPGYPGRMGSNFNGLRRGGPQQDYQETMRRRMGDQSLMQVAAPILDNRGVLLGALALVINPTNEFTKTLSVSRFGNSGETYAFDQTGLLLSQSRFDDQLRKLKLLNETNTSSAVTIRLQDPTAEAVDGVRPFTHFVSEAVTGDEGVDVEPSKDYRGVPVVGAWRWLSDYGFGIATQIDASEAYQPLRVLKLLFTMLCLLLLLCATGMFVFSYANFTGRRKLSEAELKLKQLGQYTLEERIGEGGMGIVYRARHALLRRDTAVKLLTPDRADALSIARFEREVVLTCQLTHPNTIQVYDYGHTPEGIFYYAMEFLRGLNLHELVARFGPQPEGRVIYILTQVCDSLNEAHALGLVHRDIKPANVFLCNRAGVPDWVKVLDFGLVREYGSAGSQRAETTSGKGLEGTPWFMPPEAIKDSRLNDPRSDIYSVAALGYYLLTGQFVFDGESIYELCEKHLSDTPIAPGRRGSNPVTDELDALILKCLSKDPADRPQTAMELRGLLMDTPSAGDWTTGTRLAWWARYQISAGPRPGEPGYVKPTTPDVTVRIDFASRM